MMSDEMRNAANQTLLTTSEAAKLLNAHPNSVRKWADEGLLDCYRIGSRGHRRFPLEDLKNFLSVSKEKIDSYAQAPRTGN